MRKYILILMVFLMLMPVALFAKGKKDAEVVEEVRAVTLVQVSRPQYNELEGLRDEWLATHPNVTLKWVPQGHPGTSADALIAAGDPPNIIICTPGGLGKFMVPGFAMDLSNMIDVNNYHEGTLDLYMREGELLGTPWMIALNALSINLDLAEQVGFEVPEGTNWSIDEFLQFCELVKQKAPGCYGTAIWAGNTGSTYINLQWLAGFGTEIFREGDYSKTVLDSPATVEGFKFIKMLVDKGYAPPEAGVLDDDEAVAMWAAGKLGTMWARAGGWLNMIESAVEQGMSEKIFENQFVTWPQAEDVEKVPLTFGGTAGMVILSGDDYIDSVAADYLAFLSKEYPKVGPASGAGYSPRIDAPNPTTGTMGYNGDVLYQQIFDVFLENGLYDIGYTTKIIDAFMAEWLHQLQSVISGKVTAEDASKELGRVLNELLTE